MTHSLETWIQTLENLNLTRDFNTPQFIQYSGIISYSEHKKRHYVIKIYVESSQITNMSIQFSKGKSFMNGISFSTTKYTTPDRFIRRHFTEFRNSKIENII